MKATIVVDLLLYPVTSGNCQQVRLCCSVPWSSRQGLRQAGDFPSHTRPHPALPIVQPDKRALLDRKSLVSQSCCCRYQSDIFCPEHQVFRLHFLSAYIPPSTKKNVKLVTTNRTSFDRRGLVVLLCLIIVCSSNRRCRIIQSPIVFNRPSPSRSAPG
jgi:hypothetical protein